MTSILPKLRTLSSGTIIPKPEAKSGFTVKGWGERNGQPALIYFVPNHSNPKRRYQKGITVAEWEQAHRHLLDAGALTKKWFDEQLPRCSKEGSCNFTTIGGIFSLFNIAVYQGNGVYRKI